MALSGWRRRRESPPWSSVVYWVIDLETTGLDERTDAIVSVGMVPIRDGVIQYGQRFASLVQPPAARAAGGVGIHHILPSEVAGAPPLADVVSENDRRLREGFAVMHHAAFDVGFLTRAYRDTGRAWPRVRVIDTLDLLVRLHRTRHRFTPYPPALASSLTDARRELGLPPHDAHRALDDAVATAELFLALRSRLGVCTLRGLG